MPSNRMLAVIMARGGSKGIPGKNIRPFAGLPLIAHSVLLAKMCPEITRCIVSTDSSEIAQVARSYGAETPFTRPVELAQDQTPAWPVLRHALTTVEEQEGAVYDYFLLLDPTTPIRMPEDISAAYQKLRQSPQAVGIVSVSKPDFSPIWHSVIDDQGWMRDLHPQGSQFNRRQDVPDVYRINGAFYIWKTAFVHQQSEGWRNQGPHLMYPVTDFYSISIDNLEEFNRAQLFVSAGLVRLPWVKQEVGA